ncbi:unnamed protein product [Discosporangium mesarthrocarpum]
MVLVVNVEAFLQELKEIYALCKERGAGSVYTTRKTIKNKDDGQERCLVRAKLSNKKHRKISVLVPMDEVAHFQERVNKITSWGIEGSTLQEARGPKRRIGKKKERKGSV